MGVDTNLGYAPQLLFPAPNKCRAPLETSGPPDTSRGTSQAATASPESPADQNRACQRPEADFEASELRFGKPDPAAKPDQLQELKTKFQARFKVLAAQSPEKLEAIYKQAFGAKLDQEKLAGLMKLAQTGSLPLPQTIRFLDPETLQDAEAAYSKADGGTVFMSQDLLEDPVRLFEVFAEEAGHHLDQVLGGADSPGDEGEILARGLLKGEPLSEAEIAEARVEKDQRVIKVDGVDTEVECFVLPALPVVAAYLGKTALATSVDLAFEYAIAALTGVPPTFLDNATTAALNLVPGIDVLKKAEKLQKLRSLITKTQKALKLLETQKIPGSHGVIKRFDEAQKALIKSLESADVGGAQAAIKRMLGAIQDSHKLKAPLKAVAPIQKFVSKNLGKKIGEGGNKDVFTYGKDKVIAVLKPGKPESAIGIELTALARLKQLGFPTVNITGLTRVNGRSAMIMDKYALGSKDIVRIVDGKHTIVGSSPHLKQTTIKELEALKQKLLDENIQIDDLQLLIDKNGHVVINDPRNVLVGNGKTPERNFAVINKLIEAAKRNL